MQCLFSCGLETWFGVHDISVCLLLMRGNANLILNKTPIHANVEVEGDHRFCEFRGQIPNAKQWVDKLKTKYQKFKSQTELMILISNNC